MYNEAISVDKKRSWTKKDSTPDGLSLAQDLMQPNPVFLRTDSTIQHAMEAFRKQGVSSLLAVCENPLDGSLRLSGRICIKEVFRQLFPSLLQKDIVRLNQVLHKSIDKILIQPQQTVNPLSDIKEILSVMLQEFPHAAGVEQDGKLVGQIYPTDLLGLFKPIDNIDDLWAQLIGPGVSMTITVSMAMARHVLCLWPKDEISKAVGVFMAAATLNIPILDEKGHLERIVSQMDVLEYILELFDSKGLKIFDKKGLILDRNIGSLAKKAFMTIPDNDSLANAVKKMIEKNNFCLSVTDTRQRFCGLLSLMEILGCLCHHRIEQPD
jgi:CBS-domain-containing membrane protein